MVVTDSSRKRQTEEIRLQFLLQSLPGLLWELSSFSSVGFPMPFGLRLGSLKTEPQLGPLGIWIIDALRRNLEGSEGSRMGQERAKMLSQQESSLRCELHSRENPALFDPLISQSFALGCWEMEGNLPGEEIPVGRGRLSGEGDSYALFVTNIHSGWWMSVPKIPRV